MQIKYYSDITNEYYDDEPSLKKAETDFQIAKLEAERKEKADAAERKRRKDEVAKAWKHYELLVKQYERDYGSKNSMTPIFEILFGLLEA